MIAGIELRSWLCAALAVAAGAALAPRPASAQDVGRAPDQGPHFVVRAYYLFDSFSHHESAFGVDTTTTVSYRGKPGGGVDAEYLVTPWLGFDLAASQTHIEADEVNQTPVGPPGETKSRIQVRPFTLGLYGHFYRAEHADIYLGPIVSFVQLSGGGGRPDETNFGFGAALGIDLPLGSTGLAISGVGRALASRFHDQLHNASHFRDNFLFGGGLSYRW
jgi:hypothetical protein